MRVRLVVPDGKKLIPNDKGEIFAEQHGMHHNYDGKAGRVIAGAGTEGAFVAFDGMAPRTYVGCPVAWLVPI